MTLTKTENNQIFKSGMAPAIAIMLDEKLFERVSQIANYMSKAEGFIPPHLIGKKEACFAIVSRSLTWKLDPFAVAQSTYSPAPGKVGFEGKLCHAIIENSGQLDGGITFEEYGDWSKVMGKFEIKTNSSGKKYPVATYTEKDEEGLGVVVCAKIKGEQEKRVFKIDMRQAHPRNSTLWATDPLTQLKYRAVRGLGNIAMPGIFMGVPFDDDTINNSIKDVTPAKSSATDNLNKEFLGNSVEYETKHNEDGEVIEENTHMDEHMAASDTHMLELPEIKIGQIEINGQVAADWEGFVNEISIYIEKAPDVVWLNKLFRNFSSPINNMKPLKPELHQKLMDEFSIKKERLGGTK